MELISRISKGSKMDQIYIPKNRNGLSIGSYVTVKPLETAITPEKPYLYRIQTINPIKLRIIEEILGYIGTTIEGYENVIITGSFLNKSFDFNDIDIIIISDKSIGLEPLKKEIAESIGISAHIIVLSNKTLIQGLATDPLYILMLSRCISKKRVIYQIKRQPNYKILDIHLLKSKTLIDSFDALAGKDKYYLTRNMVAIYLYLKAQKITHESIDSAIKKLFGLENISRIKDNLLDKKEFINKYKKIYNEIFNSVMRGIKNEPK